MADNYGASLAGVRGHLQHHELTSSSKPSEADAQRFLNQIGGWVLAKVGQIPEASERYTLATTAVELGAAAMVESGAFPERAAEADTELAGWLWNRYREALADLQVADAEVDELPDAYFPEPIFTGREEF